MGFVCLATGTVFSTMAYNFKNCQRGQAAAVCVFEVRKMEFPKNISLF